MTTPQPAALPECIAHVEDWPDDRTPIGLVWDVDPISVPAGTKLYALAALQSQPAAPQGVLMRLAAIAAECSDPDTTDALDALIASASEQPAAAGVSDAEIESALGAPNYHNGFGRHPDLWTFAQIKRAIHALRPQSEPDELSPDFTDTARAALLWVLWHHQGGSSPVGQPIRYALGMGAHESLNAWQVSEAKRWAAITGSQTGEFHDMRRPQAVPMTEADLLACVVKANCLGGVPLSNRNGHYHIDTPSDAVVRLKDAIEAHHGITAQGEEG